MTKPQTSDKQVFGELGAQVRDAMNPPQDEVRQRAHLKAFQASIAHNSGPQKSARSRTPVRALAMAAGTVAIAVGVVAIVTAAVWLARFDTSRPSGGNPQQPFQITTDGQTIGGVEGAWIQAEPKHPVGLRFGSGSQVVIAPGGRARVLSSGRTAVRCQLQRGTLRAHVIKKPGTRWTVQAGPYEVHVVGTRFSVSWSATVAELAVRVTHGQVQVTGASLSAVGIAVEAGRALRVEHRKGALTLGPLQPVAAKYRPNTESPVHPQPANRVPGSDASDLTAPRQPWPKAKARSARSTSPLLAPTIPASTASHWRRLFDAGKYHQILLDAQKTGLSGLLPLLSVDSLWILAHCCRYSGQGALAMRVLRTVRDRFGASNQARRAAFLLGRVAMDTLRQPRSACRWFDRYLQESPRGLLAQEALGRLVDACEKAGRHGRAKRGAKAYLARYPRGIFRKVAEHVLRRKSAAAKP